MLCWVAVACLGAVSSGDHLLDPSKVRILGIHCFPELCIIHESMSAIYQLRLVCHIPCLRDQLRNARNGKSD